MECECSPGDDSPEQRTGESWLLGAVDAAVLCEIGPLVLLVESRVVCGGFVGDVKVVLGQGRVFRVASVVDRGEENAEHGQVMAGDGLEAQRRFLEPAWGGHRVATGCTAQCASRALEARLRVRPLSFGGGQILDWKEWTADSRRQQSVGSD